MFVLTALRGPRRWLSRRSVSKERLVIELRPGAEAGSLVNELFNLEGVTIKSVSVQGPDEQGTKTISAEIKGSDIQSSLARLAEHDDVTDMGLG
ncbi:hypothetical protein BH23ACT12_BH23ACT12_23830 [soil metagenome]